MSMNISIVMATCNGESHLAEQLESLRRQTLPPRELIISDDDSTDGTWAILQNFAATAPFPVRLLRNRPRLGFQENFLGAAARATGEWIAFCDQDDLWSADKLDRCAALTVPSDVTLIAHQAVLIDTNGQCLGPYQQGIAQTGIIGVLSHAPWRLYTGFSMIFRRRVLEVLPGESRFLGSDGTLAAHDRWVSFLAQTLGRTLVLAEPLVSYRQHGGNVYGVRRRAAFGWARRAGEEVHHVAVAARRMASLVDQMPSWTEEAFPGFDRARARALYAAEAAYFEGRDAIYGATRARALGAWLTMVRSGRYWHPAEQRLRWRAAGKDLFHALVPSGAARRV